MSFWSQATVLVTGAYGFLGRHLTQGLMEGGCEKVTALKRSECDLRKAQDVGKLFEGKTFDVVFHLAASVGGIGANRRCGADFFYDNVLMGLHLIHAASQTGVKRLVLLGTICAYPKSPPMPFREESLWEGYPEETNAPYGIAKRSLLVAAQAYEQQYGLNYVGVLPTNLYGPWDDFDLETSHVIPALIRKCEEARRKHDKTVVLWGTGKPTRDFLYAKDAVRGLMLAAEKEEAGGQVINLGSEREISILELSALIAQVVGWDVEFVWDATRPDGQVRRCVSNEKARAVLGFEPVYTLEKGLEETVRWYRNEVGQR